MPLMKGRQELGTRHVKLLCNRVNPGGFASSWSSREQNIAASLSVREIIESKRNEEGWMAC